MATPWGLTCLFIGLNILQICDAHPMENLLSGSEGPNGQVMGVLVAVMVSVCVVFILLACVCCKRRSGFKDNENEKKVFRNSPVTASVINETSLSGDDPGHVNPIASAEFTIFTPLSPPHHNNNVFRSQPPVICYTENEAAPELNKAVNPQIDGIDVSEWFADTEYDFPRSRLKYTRELGNGWFGRVVEGEAHGIDSPDPNNPTWTPVAVRILESSAPAHEQAQFLHEAAVYRVGSHPNLLRLLGRSLEATPLLLIQEFCPKGDLKKFLMENREYKDSEVMVGVPLSFCCQLAAAVQYLHEHNLPHLDLAARTCQIASDLSLKLGDYGLAVSHYPNDYYQGTPSIPVRWCAPESVNHTNTTLQPKQVTLEANVWSLAVTFWEICEWGRLPYDWLCDDEVISQVMDTPHTRLPQPALNAYYIPPLYRLMEYCWLPDQNRPQINQIYSMLVHLSKTYTSPSTQPETNDFSTENFDLRWESFKPNTIIKTDNARTKSASLTNLHGSFENLAEGVNDTIIQMDSWLENVASHTDDMQYVRGLSEAIHELDTALASEQTSSSSSFEPTPNSSLGPARSDTVLHMDDSSNLDSLIFHPKRSESGSETEDETWRRRIERGAYSEKVKQKSKSVADLMVLTHIDMNEVKDIFQEELKKLHEERRESLLFVPVKQSNPIDQLHDVNIIQKKRGLFAEENKQNKITKSNFELSGSNSVGNTQRIPLKSSKLTKSLVQPDKSLTDVSINAAKESLIQASEKKIENNLLKSSVNDKKENLVVVPQIIDNKPNSETVPSVSDSKLEENPIKLVESNQIKSTANENTNQEISCNFDTFLQQTLTNKIDTIESKETVILTPENGNKVLEIIDNFNQNILSNEILVKHDVPKNTTAISTPEKVIDNSEKDSRQETITNIKESQSTEILEKIHYKPSKHIEPISVKSCEFSLIQDFINCERNDVILTTPSTIKESVKKLIHTEEMANIRELPIITPQTKETLTIDTDLELEKENIQLKEDILENIIEVEELKLKDTAVSNKSETNTKSTNIVKEILPDGLEEKEIIVTASQDNESCVQNKDRSDIQTVLTENVSPVNEEILEANKVDLQPKEEVKITKTIDSILTEKLNASLPIIDTTTKDKESVDLNKGNEYEIQMTLDNLEPKETTSLEIIEESTVKDLPVDKKTSIKYEQLIDLIDTQLQIHDKLEINLQKQQVADDKEIKESSNAFSLLPELQISENLLYPEATNKKSIPETIEENLVQKEEISIVTNIPENKETSNMLPPIFDYLVESELQTEETNNLISIPPPLEFIEEPIEIKELRKEEEIIKIEPTIDTANVLVELDEITVNKEDTEIIENYPKAEEQEKETDELITGNLLDMESQSDESLPDLIDTSDDLKTEILLPEADKISESLSKEITIVDEKEVKQLENKVFENLIKESTIEDIKTKQNDPIIIVKSNEFSLIQNFINNERNNNLLDLIPSEVKPEVKETQKTNEDNNLNLPPVSSDLTSDLLDTSNVQQINQIFNVFNVTVDHKPPLECFTSPVKKLYARPFDQNEIITDINSLLESERKKYESKSSVCSSSLQNDFLPFVNGISSELSDKIIEFLNKKDEKVDNGDHEPKKLAEIALTSLKKNLEHSEVNTCEENITNGHDGTKELTNKIELCEKPKRLSEIRVDSLKTNSVSEDSGICCLKYEENGIKYTEESLKNSADSLDDILSNTEDENELLSEVKEIAKDIVNSISEEAPKKLNEIVKNKLRNGFEQIPQTIELYKTFELVPSFVEQIECAKSNEQAPKKLSEIVQDSLNKTYTQSEVSQNLPDIVLDYHQNKTFVKDQNLDNTFEKSNDEILINVINDSPVKSLNSFGDKFDENSESTIEDVLSAESDKNILNVTVDSPRKLSEIILDSLPCNSPVTSESTDNVSDKTVIDVKASDNSAENNQICDEAETTEPGENLEYSSTNFLPTSTPFKSNSNLKKTDVSFFSFVSEGDEPSDCQTRVILGPCEEYGLGLYSGLKTTFGKFSDDDTPEEELLQFSSNFMPYDESDTTHNSVDYSLETWDKFLGKSLQDQDNCSSLVFDNFSPKHESLDVFNGKSKNINNETEVKNEDLNKTITITNNKNNETFKIENEVPEAETNMKEDESDQVETTQSSWEPGEGWFLHPQSAADDLTGQIDISGGDNVDNSYVGFALDEECVNALRNELAAKLPHAQGMSHEEPQEPEEWDTEERNEIIVKYNVYATPLSPIPEESCCDDIYCDQMQHRYMDGSDSESEWSEPCLGQTSQLEEDILVIDTETHTALILESPSLREPQHRHTPSQDSCCSNDTLFNLEDLNYGHSPQHHGLAATAQHTEPDSEQILEIEINENETPKQSPIQVPKIETEENLNSDSTEMNLTYTKPDINIDESENSNHKTVLQDSQPATEQKSLNKLELKLDPNAFGVAPLPSPEDIPWRQLPASLLTYNEVVQNDKYEIQDSEEGPTDTIENIMDQEDLNLAQENTNDDLSDSVRGDCTLDTDLYSNLTDIRFSGPCDAQLMSTSFSESADYAEERDWDSGSDTRSSSSGEFIWKEGEHEESLRALHAASHDVGVTEDINPMDAIEEENSNSSEDSDDCEEDMEETEFVPSAWDAQATPTKSALRSPEKSTKRKVQQKGVWFKKQKYHCVYEYPREPESPVAPPSDLWRPLSDLSTFADWELDPESCVAPSFEDTIDGSYDVLDKFITRSTYPLTSGNTRHRDLYQLNPFPEFTPGLSSSDEDFFISSSARPFQAIGQSSQFFPGQNPPKSKFLWQDYQSSSQQSSRDLSDGITPDSGIDDVTPASCSESGLVDILPSQSQKVPPLKCLAAIAANKTPPSEQKTVDSSLGGLRHTRNRLKLDLPPSPNSFSSTRTFSIDVSCNDPVIIREIPTFTTFGKSRFSVQHVATPTDECSDPLQIGKPKAKNVSFEALPHKPMKLTETVYILDKAEDDGKKPVEMVQGEASLLDSADEDSGIESSANATLERHQQQILN